jgi:hypothetical protein
MTSQEIGSKDPFNNKRIMINDLILTDFENKGYAILPQVNPKEGIWLYKFIENIWLKIISDNYPIHLDEAKKIGLSNYHHISDKIDHSKLWSKDNRILSKENTLILINNLSVFKILKSLFLDFIILDLEGIGYPEIYWRLVRPNSDKDVALAHKDTWFFSSTNNLTPENQTGIAKIWFPVCIENSISGLAVSPKSHIIDIPHSTELRHGRIKPTGDENVLNSYPMELLDLKPGQAVLFDRNLLHKGIAHKGSKTRVSIEFAFKSNILS